MQLYVQITIKVFSFDAKESLNVEYLSFQFLRTITFFFKII